MSFVPIRCFTCGKLINNRYDEYIKRVENGEKYNDVLDVMGYGRICCRRMFMTHVDIEKYQLQYPVYETGVQILGNGTLKEILGGKSDFLEETGTEEHETILLEDNEEVDEYIIDTEGDEEEIYDYEIEDE